MPNKPWNGTSHRAGPDSIEADFDDSIHRTILAFDSDFFSRRTGGQNLQRPWVEAVIGGFDYRTLNGACIFVPLAYWNFFGAKVQN